MSLWCFDCVGVILRDIFRCDHQPTDVITGLDCLEPSRLDRKATYRMHPSNRLFGGREIIYTVSFVECVARRFRGMTRYPLSSFLYERNAISAAIVAFPDEDGRALASDEYILLPVYRNPFLREN